MREMTTYPARFYAAVHDGNPGDVEFYQRRCASVRSIVELGCGDARVLASLAAEGRTLVGVDIDAEQLELAAARARACGATLELVEADMREVDLSMMGTMAHAMVAGRGFDRVIIPHGGIYCLLDEAALAATLRRAAALLSDSGLLLLDAWAADDFHDQAEPEDQDPSWLERVKTIELDGEHYEVLERSSWDKPRQRLDVTYIHVRVGSEDVIEGLLQQRYVLSEQLCAALEQAGLDLVELAGDFDGGPHDTDSAVMVVTARRRV
jgi:SAM-dependent methyltransferase